MRLTLAGEYAIRAMVYLSELEPGRRAQIAEISAACGVPENFLRNIMLKLAKSQLVSTHRGANGGVMLINATDKITLLDVIEAIEGKLALNHCLVSSQDFCGRMDWCAVHQIWSVAQQKMVEELTKTTLKELVQQNRIRYAKFLQQREKATVS